MPLGTIDIILLVALVSAAVWTVLSTRLIRSVICLAVTSVLLSVVMFRLDSPLAAVFELSVCAGLISAVFLSTITVTRRVSPEDMPERRRARMARFWLLPVLVVLLGIALSRLDISLQIPPHAVLDTDVRNVLWNVRHLDLLGQVAVLLGGAFGVVILFKEYKNGQ